MSDPISYDPRDYGPGGKHWKPDPENPMCHECGTRDSDWVELLELREKAGVLTRSIKDYDAMAARVSTLEGALRSLREAVLALEEDHQLSQREMLETQHHTVRLLAAIPGLIEAARAALKESGDE